MDDNEKPIYDELIQLLDCIDPWLERNRPDSARPAPPPRSPLYGDDKATDPYHLSHAAWFALTTALDHLHMHRTVLRDAHAIHMFAPYSLLRGAFENGCAAVWMLAPASRNERVLRRLRHHTSNIINAEQVNALVGLADADRQAERKQSIAGIAGRRGIDPTEALKKVGYGEIVAAAGQHTGLRSRTASMVWRLCSGTAHGDFWSLTALADRKELPGAPPGIAHLHVRGDVAKLRYLTFFAVSMVADGWRLYDQRCAVP